MAGRVDKLIKNFDSGRFFDRIMERAGRLLVSAFQQSFRDQGIGPHQWPERAELSLPAIAEDLRKGPHIQAVWFRTRPAGVGPGDELRKSLSYRRIGQDRLKAGSWLRCAKQQQEGGSKTVTLDKTLKDNLRDYLSASGNRLTKRQRKRLGAFLDKDSVKMRIPPRPFVVYTPELETKVHEIMRQEATR